MAFGMVAVRFTLAGRALVVANGLDENRIEFDTAGTWHTRGLG